MLETLPPPTTAGTIRTRTAPTAIDPRVLAYYSPEFFGYLYLRYNAPWHQREIGEQIIPVTHAPGQRFILLIEPRKHGKTTEAVDKLPTWGLCTNFGGAIPDPRILIISEAKTTAEKRLHKIKTNLTTNPGILRDYGDLRGDKWLYDKIYCRRQHPSIDPSVEAVGVAGAITGGAYHLILCDDPCSLENQRTETMRKTISNWFRGTVIPLLEDHGTMVVIGTRKHYQDLYYELMQEPGWTIVTRTAILDDDAHQTLFPEKWPYPAIQHLKAIMGPSAFARELMNSPVPAEGLQFKTDWLQWIRPDRIPLQNLTAAMWLDPAFGKSDVACNNALAVLGKTPDNKLYLLDMQRWKGDLDMTLDQVLHAYDTWQPLVKQLHSIYIESNWHQKIIPHALHKLRLLPLQGIEQHTDKIARIQSLEPYYASGQITHADTPSIRRWVHEEYQPFPDVDLIDGLDALASLVNQLAGSIYRAGSWHAL